MKRQANRSYGTWKTDGNKSDHVCTTPNKNGQHLRYRLATTTQDTGGGGGHNSSRVWRWRGSRTSVLSTENSGVPFLSNIQGRFLLTLVHTISYSVKKRVMTSKEKKNLKEVTKKENPVGVFVMKIKRNTKCYKSDKEKPVSQSVFRPYSQCALGERLSFQCLSFVRE